MDHLALGRWGEERSCEFLSGRGWRILDRNVAFSGGELDIVAMDGNELVVVEVRTRSVGRMLPPDRSVGPRKLRHLVSAGCHYVVRNDWKGLWRIDLIAITMDREGGYNLEHLRDITNGEVVV